MRPIERISIVLKAFKKKNVLKKFLKPYRVSSADVKIILENLEEIEKYWLENSDLRFGQFLINHGYITDSSVWFVEEVDWLIENKIVKPRDILFWTSIYDENGKKLKKSKVCLIKDMTKSHIKYLLRDVKNGKQGIRLDYKLAFEKELKLKKR